MRNLFLSTSCILALVLCAIISAQPKDEKVDVKIRLVDAETGKPRGGMVRIFPGDGDKPMPIPGLLDRLRGLPKSESVGWHVVPADGVVATLPRARLRLEALAGLETVSTRQDLDLSAGKTTEVTVKLKALFRPEESDLVAGNTHLHLRGLSRAEADDYLRQIPAADGLKVMFISYLERHKDDETYITNRYPIGDLKQFDATGVLFNNGEEHRHNFQGFGQGYGHVMLLDIKELVKPVSIGPGIMATGTDDPALRPGIDEARKQGGTVIWCHNTNGFEDVPNALTGRLDALNVFDGSRTGTFEESYYRFLNVGMRLPISTGTDWFIYDFSRVYAQVRGKLTIKSWLEAVKAGRCQATNGPLLSLKVDGQSVGEVIKLDGPKTVRVEATGLGRHNYKTLQLIQNGKVIATESAKEKDGAFSCRLEREVRIDAPAWFAVRIDSPTRNELDHVLYAHTSPVYVDYQGKQVYDVEAARALLRQIEEGQADIRARAKFSNMAAGERVLAIYEEAAAALSKRTNERPK